MIVIDACALIEFLVGDDPTSEQVRDHVATERLAVPQGTDLEVASALRGLVLGGKRAAERGAAALDLLGSMPIRRYSIQRLMSRVWDLGDNMWPYDAAFVALAETLDVPLVTVDVKFSRTPGIRCRVEVVRSQGVAQ